MTLIPFQHEKIVSLLLVLGVSAVLLEHILLDSLERSPCRGYRLVMRAGQTPTLADPLFRRTHLTTLP